MFLFFIYLFYSYMCAAMSIISSRCHALAALVRNHLHNQSQSLDPELDTLYNSATASTGWINVYLLTYNEFIQEKKMLQKHSMEVF